MACLCTTMQNLMIACLVLLGTFSTTVQEANNLELNILVNSSDVRGGFKHFWRSTGFCPPQPHSEVAHFDLSSDMVQNLAYIGALPHRGIKQVRVHWLLDLIKVTSISSIGPVYDMRKLDSLVKLMHQNDLVLGFELMGSPSGIYTDFENHTQVYWFRNLVTLIGIRYIKMYGLSYVKEWNFETWNEPDCHDFDKTKFTVQGFLNYYDACSQGLKDAHPALRLGGPGDACWPNSTADQVSRSRDLFDALMNHTIRGTNFFTGKKDVRLDFISIHEKGDGIGFKILEREINASRYLTKKFPELADVPFINDEADPLVQWSRPLEWRATAEYAAIVAKVIGQHQNILGARSGTEARDYLRRYDLLSNDNAFLSFYPNQFTQRTLLARFQINSTSHGKDNVTEVTKPVNENKQRSYVTFVRKPAYIVMEMLSLLGDEQVFHKITQKNGHILSNTSDFGALATIHNPKDDKKTSDSWQMTVLLYGAGDVGGSKQNADTYLKLFLEPPKGVTALKMMIRHLYKDWGNPYGLWHEIFNSTKYPSLLQFAQLRQEENPQGLVIDVPVAKGFIPPPPIFEIRNPHIIVLHLCAKPSNVPEKVIGVRFINITAGQVMVVWSDRNIYTKCILTYEVEFCPTSPHGPFSKINNYNTVVNVFLHETESEEKVRGYYRIRAIDYFGQAGIYSDVVSY